MTWGLGPGASLRGSEGSHRVGKTRSGAARRSRPPAFWPQPAVPVPVPVLHPQGPRAAGRAASGAPRSGAGESAAEASPLDPPASPPGPSREVGPRPGPPQSLGRKTET